MSELKVNKITPRTGTTITLGDSGDSLSIASGVALTDFTSTGIDDNATSTALTIDSSENVLIGKTSTSSALAGTTLWNSGYLNSTVASDYVARFNRTTSDGDVVQIYKDNASIGVIDVRNANNLHIRSTSANHVGIEFGTNQILPVDASGALSNNNADIGSSSYQFKDLYLSGSAYLGGTAAANALDDYEESAWTPTFAQGYTGITYVNQYGWYRKVGTLVVVSCAIQFTATADGNTVRINLPFTQTHRNYGGGGIPYTNINDFSNTNPYVGFNQSYVQYYEIGTGTNTTTTISPSSGWISFVVSMATS